MNLGTIRAEVLGHGFDPTQFGIGRINQYINDAYLWMVSRVDYYVDESTQSFSTVVGTTNYLLPADLGRVRELFRTDVNIVLPSATLRQIDNSPLVNAAPGWYALDAGNIHIYPTPDAIYPLELRYWALPPILVSDSDIPTIPAKWHRLLWYWANAECFSAEDDNESAQYWWQKFATSFQEFAADVKFPSSDFPTQVSGWLEKDNALSARGWSLYIGP